MCLSLCSPIRNASLFLCYSGSRLVCFNTFCKLKHWLRVRRSGKYFGQFDCYLCLRRKQIPLLQAKATTDGQRMELGQELQRCERHHALTFGSAISTSSAGLLSSHANCWS